MFFIEMLVYFFCINFMFTASQITSKKILLNRMMGVCFKKMLDLIPKHHKQKCKRYYNNKVLQGIQKLNLKIFKTLKD